MDDSISRQAAADVVNFECGEWRGLAKTIIGKLEALPSAQPEQRWIPCSEMLPEDDVEVLVTDDAGGVQWLGVDKMMSYEDGSGRFWLISQHPSAWFPLPEPYRPEGEKVLAEWLDDKSQEGDAEPYKGEP